MFIKQTKKSGKTYLALVEAYWEDGQSKQRTISSLGALESFSRDQLVNLGSKFLALAGVAPPQSLEGLQEVQRLNWGCSAICKRLWTNFLFSELFARLKAATKIKFQLEDAIFRVVSTRLSEPMTKLSLFHSQQGYAGAGSVDLQHLYRCLDFLCAHKDAIESHIFKINRNLFNMKVDVVFYDVTTFYFESNRPDLFKNFGYSKDCKFGEVQVVMGMIMNGEGRPVGFEYFPGNTFEGSTLTVALESLKRRFNIDRVIVVADRGMNSKFNLKTIRDLGFHYIVGSRLKSMNVSLQKQILDVESYSAVGSDSDSNPVFKLKEFSYNNTVVTESSNPQGKLEKHTQILQERLLCSWSLERATKDRKDRERLILKATELAKNPAKVLDKRGAKKYLKPLINEASEYSVDQSKIDADAKWDGIYGLQTSDQNLSQNDVMDAYKNLWRIEEIFRTLKSTLEMRPMFHWTPDRIKGHMVACFISFVFERTIELAVQSHYNQHLSSDAIRDAIYSMQMSKIVTEQNQTLLVRSQITPDADKILTAMKVQPPKAAQLI